MRYALEGRTVLVTGAAGGIGRALASAFAEQGARLLLLDRDAAGLKDLCSERASLQSMAAAQGRSAEEVEQDILSRQALPGMLSPADIAGVYLFLASDGSRSITGQSLVASHGEVMA